MTLDPNRWTLKTQDAVNVAIAEARSRSNPEVTPDHLLAALLVPAVALAAGPDIYKARHDNFEAMGKAMKGTPW